ncbi:MAG: UDP-glucose 4-epimerase GalE [bacterium JZ-2024 1]
MRGHIQRVLVTGGAGYLGSFVVRALLETGIEPVVVDNLVTGHRKAVPEGIRFLCADVRRTDLLDQLMDTEADAVVHLAALSLVSESRQQRRAYYETNALGTANILRWMDSRECRLLVYSSSAGVYGNRDTDAPIAEQQPVAPISTYGETKVAAESLIENWVQLGSGRAVIHRIFNLAGASRKGEIGEDHNPETHLIPLAVRAVASGQGTAEPLRLFGGDYPTRDGFPIRDYVHPEDVARAIVLSLRMLSEERGHRLVICNIAGGIGHTSLEVVRMLERIAGKAVPYERAPRREGDPASLVADIRHANEILGWAPTYTLEDILQTALMWAQMHPNGYEDKCPEQHGSES